MERLLMEKPFATKAGLVLIVLKKLANATAIIKEFAKMGNASALTVTPGINVNLSNVRNYAVTMESANQMESANASKALKVKNATSLAYATGKS